MPLLITPKYLHRAPFALQAVGIDLPEIQGGHPNRLPFAAVLTRIDEPSDRPPSGAKDSKGVGHRVLIPREVAEAALPTLLGMAVDMVPALDDHDARRKIGVITDATIDGKDLRVRGFLYAKDFPDAVAAIRAKRTLLGMSYEISDVEVDDPDAPIWTLRHLTFTGAAILEKTAAAYERTAIAAKRGEKRSGTMATRARRRRRTLQADVQSLTRTIRRAIRAAKDDEDDDAQARRDDDDEEARREDDEEGRTRARRDDDDEEARRDEEDEEARREEEDEDARRDDDDDEDAKADDDDDDQDARRDEEDEEAVARALLRALGDPRTKNHMRHGLGGSAARRRMLSRRGRAKKADDEESMAMLGRLAMQHLMDAMTYGPGHGPGSAYPGGTGPHLNLRTDHDDAAEDMAMLRKLRLVQGRKRDAHSETPVSDDLAARRLDRKVGRLEAAMGDLVTDTLKPMMGLLTDMQTQLKNLATDNPPSGANGGQVQRRTMAAHREADFVSKYGLDTSKKYSTAQIDEVLRNAGVTDPVQRMGIKHQLEAQGMFSD